jgi:hypothetical protein
MQQELQSQLEGLIGSYGWMFLVGFAAMLFRSAIEGAVEGFKVGFFKTIFFVYEVGTSPDGKPYVKSGNKMAIQNDQLKTHKIEKPLSMLDLSRWEKSND